MFGLRTGVCFNFADTVSIVPCTQPHDDEGYYQVTFPRVPSPATMPSGTLSCPRVTPTSPAMSGPGTPPISTIGRPRQTSTHGPPAITSPSVCSAEGTTGKSPAPHTKRTESQPHSRHPRRQRSHASGQSQCHGLHELARRGRATFSM
jgi:hypothetical protein